VFPAVSVCCLQVASRLRLASGSGQLSVRTCIIMYLKRPVRAILRKLSVSNSGLLFQPCDNAGLFVFGRSS